MKIPTKNLNIESLPDYGFVTLEKVGSNEMFIWNGHKRGRGRERAVICWRGYKSTEDQACLNGKVEKHKRYGSTKDDELFKRIFKTSR